MRNIRTFTHLVGEERLFWDQLPPEVKLQIVDAMGFTPYWNPHRFDCPKSFDGGNRCNCVPEATQWGQPPDVDEYRGETWDERLAAARARTENQ